MRRRTMMPLMLAAFVLPAATLNAQDVVQTQLDALAESLAGEAYAQVGQPHTGYVNAGGEESFQVRLEAGVSYKMVGVCDQDCDDVDLALMDSRGNELDSDYLTDDYPVLEYTASASGMYTIRVMMVNCSIEPCGWGVAIYRETGTAIAAGGETERHQGRLAAGDPQLDDGEYYDIYNVGVQAGQTITADLNSDDFDTFLILRSPAGDQTSNDDYEGDTSRSMIVHSAGESGGWQVMVTSYSAGETGSYDLAITVGGSVGGPAEVRTETGMLQKGDETLDSGEFVDNYTFQGRAGEQVTVDLRSEDFDPYLLLLTPSGEIHENDDFEGDVTRSLISVELTEDGEYTIGVTSYSAGETGSYTLRIEQSGSGGSGLRKEVGALSSGDQTLRSGEYMDVYTFQGTPGQHVRVDLTSDEFDTYLIVRGPAEDREENDDTDRTGHSAVDLDLTESGEYRVIVTSYAVGETGSYELAIDGGGAGGLVASSTGSDMVTIGPGQTLEGRLEPGDGQLEGNEYRDLYAFEGTAGQAVTIEMRSSDFDTYLGLVSPSGEDVQNDDYEGNTSVSRIDHTLPESGRYRVFATSYSAEETGAYRLSFESGAAAPSIVAAGPGPSSGGGGVYGVFVGISDYPGEANDLAYTADDARRLAAALADGAGMRQDDYVVLTDAQATRANVERAVREVGGRAGPDDVFVLFYSGHGNRVSRADFQATDPDGRDETLVFYDEEISDDDMDRLLAGIEPGVSLLFFDACFSGGFSKDVISRPGRMGLFSSEEDVTSSVAARFRAGGYLAHFLADAIGDRLADADGDGSLTAIEVSQYVHERYRADVKGGGPDDYVSTGGSQLGYQHLVVDRGSVGPNDVLFR